MHSHGMTHPITAVYPGSFDPVTNGHLDIIERAARTFDKLIVAVGRNSSKSSTFTSEERVAMLRESCAQWENVTVTSFEGLLVEYVRSEKATLVVRGLRAVSDFEFEFQIALANRQMAPDIETYFLMTSAAYLYISSSIIKEIARHGGDVTVHVPPPVQHALRQRFVREGAQKP
jgi:pantetheine-phosphate adenylyltransferase